MSEYGVLLASGGLDSTTLAYWLDKRGISFDPLFINYGQHCAATELETLQSVLRTDMLERLSVVSLSDVYSGTSSRLIAEPNLWLDNVTGDDLYLPYRNLLLLSAAAAFAQARGRNTVYSAFINSNHAKEIDCSAKFFDTLAGVMTDYGGIRVEMPFRDLSKREVVSIAIEHEVPIGLTYSCQAASSVPCGACPNCVDRLSALEQAGLT
jgi:7-cyano-7-deazaguanine synthase